MERKARMINGPKPAMDNIIAITKALSDPHRVRALFALRNGELCLCQIIELFGLAPSTVSKHMSVLKLAGLVKNRKEERWMYYRLPDTHEMQLDIQSTLTWIFTALDRDDLIENDRILLEKITTQDIKKICQMQRSK